MRYPKIDVCIDFGRNVCRRRKYVRNVRDYNKLHYHFRNEQDIPPNFQLSIRLYQTYIRTRIFQSCGNHTRENIRICD